MYCSYFARKSLRIWPPITAPPFGNATAIWLFQQTALDMKHSHAPPALSQFTAYRLRRNGYREKSYAESGDNRRTAGVPIPSRGNKVARALGPNLSAATNLSRRVKDTGYLSVRRATAMWRDQGYPNRRSCLKHIS